MNKKRIATIARNEYLENVKRKEFILMTIGFPLLMVGVMFITVLFGQGLLEEKTIGVVDNSKLFDDVDFEFNKSINKTISDGNIMEMSSEETMIEEKIKLKLYNITEAKRDLLNEKIDAYVIVPADYINSKNITIYSLKGGLSSYTVASILNNIAVNKILENANVDEGIRNFIKSPGDMKMIILTKTGEEKGEDEGILSFFSAFMFPFLFVMSVFVSSSFLLQGIVDEKENRVIEILLSSVTETELFIGKIVGLGAIGLTQIMIWGIFALPIIVTATFILPFSASTLPLIIIYFILGYVFYASIFAGVGAISTSLKEANQISGIFSMIAISPIFFLLPLLENPNALIFKIISFIPPLTPVMMMFRASSAPIYEIIFSIILLVISIAVVIKISAKVFKMGVLMDRRPSVGEIVKIVLS